MKKAFTLGISTLLLSAIANFSYANDTADFGPQSISLYTQQGFEIGGQVSGYHYQEHATANQFLMEEFGPQFGITANATKVFDRYSLFVTLDGRFAYGQNQYNGSGTMNNVDDFLGDVRLLGGKDFVFDHNTGVNWSVAPYVGIGYRNLFNDLRGTTDIGAQGYRRDSEYLYVPVGITPRFRLTDNSRISTNLEYDYLIQGWQTSSIGDFIPGATDLTNTQHTGYGLRGSIMVEWGSWAVGPYADYWNVNQSEISCDNIACGLEPHNQTIEAGLQFHYHF